MAEDENSSTSDESLDAKSDKFDPLKVLYSPKVRLSSIAAPIYDNVAKFESVIKGLSLRHVKKDNGKDVAVKAECSGSRLLPKQEAASGGKPGYGRSLQGKNVLAKMQKTLGPLGMLHGCMESRTRIKVYTRNERGIRGHVDAYVAAFDKHWNLALEDCFEVWTRKVKRKAPAALGTPAVSEEAGAEDEGPKVVSRKIEGKTETLERHVPQMLLRGEQVAIIVKIN